MKRIWYFTYSFDKLRFSFSFNINFPDKEDYYQSQYELYITLFGLRLNVGTWKE